MNNGYMYGRTRRKGKRITFIISIFIFIRYHVIVEIDNQILTKKNSNNNIFFLGGSIPKQKLEDAKKTDAEINK